MLRFPVRIVGGFAAIVALASILPTSARAQDRRVGAAARVAGIASPSSPVLLVQPGVFQPGLQDLGFPPFGSPVAGSVPVLLAPDGRVFADFGFGFQQIVNNCSSTLVIQPTPVQPSVAPQPTVTQPLPAQPTASDQGIVAMPPGATLLAAQNVGNPCWTQQSGRVFVYRR